MERFLRPTRVRILVAIAVIVVGVAIYLASMPKSDAVVIAGPHVCAYYSSGTYRTVVGARGTGCCGEPISWGITTKWVRCERLYCTQVICPD